MIYFLKKEAYVKNLTHFISELLSSANIQEGHDDCIPGSQSNSHPGSESLLNDLFWAELALLVLTIQYSRQGGSSCLESSCVS